jgi:hypothetical protein
LKFQANDTPNKREAPEGLLVAHGRAFGGSMRDSHYYADRDPGKSFGVRENSLKNRISQYNKKHEPSGAGQDILKAPTNSNFNLPQNPYNIPKTSFVNKVSIQPPGSAKNIDNPRGGNNSLQDLNNTSSGSGFMLYGKGVNSKRSGIASEKSNTIQLQHHYHTLENLEEVRKNIPVSNSQTKLGNAKWAKIIPTPTQ